MHGLCADAISLFPRADRFPNSLPRAGVRWPTLCCRPCCADDTSVGKFSRRRDTARIPFDCIKTVHGAAAMLHRCARRPRRNRSCFNGGPLSRVGGPLAPVQVAPTRRTCETLQSGARQAHGIQAGSERHGVLCRIGVLCLCRVSPRRAGRHGAAERRWAARRPRAGNRRRFADGGRRHLRPRPDHGGLDRAASPRRSSPTQTRWKQYVSWPAYGAWAADRIRRSGSTWPDHRRRPAPRRRGGRRRGSGYGATLNTCRARCPHDAEHSP